MVKFNEQTQAIECSTCGAGIPLSRQTLADGFRFAQHMEMARELHAECTGSPYEAQLQRRWHEIMLTAKHGGANSPRRTLCTL